MKVEDLFEEMRPVATVWKKRGERIERGRISKFVSNLKSLSKVEMKNAKESEADKAEKPIGGNGEAERSL